MIASVPTSPPQKGPKETRLEKRLTPCELVAEAEDGDERKRGGAAAAEAEAHKQGNSIGINSKAAVCSQLQVICIQYL